MTDRIKSLVVVLDRDIRDDDLKQTILAIAQIKNVLSIKSNVVTSEDFDNREVIRRELITKLYNVLE